MRRAVAKIMPSRPSKVNSTGQLNEIGQGAQNIPSSHTNASPQHQSFFGSHLANLGFKIDFNAIDDFYIVLDNPHKTWCPGDEVSGQIILVSKKNLANITITLSLIGYVKINASSHSKLRPVKHQLFNHTIKIYGGDDISSSINNEDFSNGLFKGEHRFPFIVKLPKKRVFTSINFGKGAIVYLLKSAIGNSSNLSSGNNSPSAVSSLYNQSPASSQGSDSNPNSPGNHLISKTKHLKLLNSPSHTSEKLIQLINPLDVAKLPPPKPKKLIIRDPRYTKKLSRTQSSTSTINTLNTFSTMSSYNSDSNTAINTNSNSHTNNNEVDQQAGSTPILPASSASASNTPGLNSSEPQPPLPSHSNSQTANTNSVSISTPPTDLVKPESIRVALDIPKRGYLRGELIPIKLNISHLKKIQDVNGIIITFVRVCRLDNSSTGLFESFRKDLQQAIIPLYVDPVTFQSEINSSVRIPADAFPTISGCPLVSFQYFIEVLINLSGKSVLLDANGEHSKVSSDDHSTSHLFDSSTSPHGVDTALQKHNGLSSGNDLFNFSFKATTSPINQNERSGFVNTDKFKRMKKFVQITTEVIIGTHRSDNSPISDDVNMNLTRPLTDNNLDNNGTGSGASPLSRRSSSFSGSGGSPAALSHTGSLSPSQQYIGTPSDQQPPQLSQQNTIPPQSSLQIQQAPSPLLGQSPSRNQSVPRHNSSQHVSYFNAIPESTVINDFETPPYFVGDDGAINRNSQDQQPIPGYDDITGVPPPHAFEQGSSGFNDGTHLVPLPDQSGMSEKDRMKAHELSLLPSEPPLEMLDDDDDQDSAIDTISPIDHANDIILDSVRQSPADIDIHPNNNTGTTTDLTNGFPSQPQPLHEGEQEEEPYQQSYQFSRNPRSHDTIIQPQSQEIQPNINEGPLSYNINEDNVDGVHNADDDGQESKLDYVPNYESAKHDRLLVSHAKTSGTGTDGS